MSDFFSSIPSTSSRVYGNYQFAPGSAFARRRSGLLVNETPYQNMLDLSSICYNNFSSHDADAPTSVDPFNPLGLEFSESNDNQLESYGFWHRSGHHDSAADTVSNSALYTERSFGLDNYIKQYQAIDEALPLVSGPSSAVSTPYVETPVFEFLPELDTGGSASSSTPPGRIPVQDRNATPSALTNMESQPNSQNPAETTSTKERVTCSYQGCGQTFCDASTMRRHVITCHMNLGPNCPGCGQKFSRDDSLKRHLDSKLTKPRCRLAAMANGWEKIERRGKRGLYRSTWARRRKLVAARDSS